MLQIIIGIIVGTVISFLIFLFSKKLLDRHAKSSFDNLSRKTMGELMPSLLDLAKRELSSVRDEINKDVEREKSVIKETLEKLEVNIKEKQEELKRLEEERNRQFGSISESIKIHKEITEKLAEKTENLSKMLSNNKLRGKWGERVLEDVLQYAGFLKDVHYVKSVALSTTGTIPDFTLMLPNSRRLNIDAKFPFDNLQAYQLADKETDKKEYLRKFEQDVKNKIREVTSRLYINEQENTLDFVIIFVPSDIIYSFINDALINVVDTAFRSHVLITAPSSLYAILRIIMEAYRHYSYEKNIKEVLNVVQGFIENFRRFEEEFAVFDDAIGKLRETYDRIVETRYNKMKVQMRKIEKLGQVKEQESLADY